jgi:uncharacterized membrane protein
VQHARDLHASFSLRVSSGNTCASVDAPALWEKEILLYMKIVGNDILLAACMGRITRHGNNQEMGINHADLPPHIEETVRSVAELQEEHDGEATAFQRGIARTTCFLGNPLFFAALTIIVVLWMSINVAATTLHLVPFDKPPFPLLQGMIALSVLYMSILIFGTQQRDEKIAAHRARLTLQLAMINEQKSAKIIERIEALRRDSPFVRNRADAQANAMATPADPQIVLEAMKEITLQKEGLK